MKQISRYAILPHLCGRELRAWRANISVARTKNFSKDSARRLEKAVSRKTNGVYRASAELSYKSKVRLEQMRTAVFGLGAKMKDSVTTRFKNAGDFVRSRSETLSETALQNYNEASERMRLLSAKLDTNNPLRILSMGYAKLYRTDGKNATLDNIKVGDEFKAVLANGKLTARVTKIQKGEGNNEA